MRKRLDIAEGARERTETKARRTDAAELRAANLESERESITRERADATARIQMLTDSLLALTSEKDLLVRHSAAQVHIEAQLAVQRDQIQV